MKKVIIITGPTGSGKSDLAIDLAQKLNTEIISADSVQVYKGFDIGSAKVTKEEQEMVPHHLIDIMNPEEQYSVADFQRDATEKIKEILAKGKIPIVCGGTGLYIHSLLYDLDFSEEKVDEKLREELENIYQREGVEALVKLLEKLDPERVKTIDLRNHRRLIRGIELAKSGKKNHTKNLRKKNEQWESYYFVVRRDREKLYEIINERTKKMIGLGLVEEAKTLYEKYGFVSPMRTIGYKEMVSYFEGEYSLEMTIEKIQQHSRNLAKRQLTWFRKEEDAIFIDRDVYPKNEEAVEYILKVVEGENGHGE